MDDPVPDRADEHLAATIDDPVPTHGYRMLPMVGLGGSAGAIPALRLFFEAMPADSGCAFVVIMHLSAEHDSALAELLQRTTAMPVLQVAQAVQPEPNHVYVIPPRHALRCGPGGRLELDDLQRVPSRHVVVDLFFRSLADTHGAHATAIVLSGIDGDGAIGIKRIKERGGLTIAQDPAEAEHPGMPGSALATGMVDWVLPAAEMPARVLAYHRSERHIRLPAEDGPQPAAPAVPADDSDESALRDVLALLRSRTGHDFSYYKRATILRRIGRRMQVSGVQTLGEYLDVLRTRHGEAGALLQDLLITVTNFFRDAHCFDALRTRLPALFHGRGPGDAVRVWVAACATGEEAYSIAMLLSEHARTLEAPPVIQVFATDLEENAIRCAREALYPLAIAADVSEARLRNFFVKEHRGYRVRRELREMVLFAVHDVLRDPPFSRLDMASCRNLLIYLTRQAQARALDIFHFALQPHGLLMLGASESVEDGSSLFSILDEKRRLYARRTNPARALPLPAADGPLTRALKTRDTVPAGPVLAGGHGFALPAPDRDKARVQMPAPSAAAWSDLHLTLLELVAPPSLLVDADNDIVHLSPSAGRFLQVPGGEPSRNVLRAIHPGLRLELRAALARAQRGDGAVQAPALAVTIGGDSVVVRMQVRPAGSEAPGLTLVLLASGDGAPAEAAAPAAEPAHAADPLSQQLDREIDHMRAQLRDTVEQYETSTEELRASNEELQAMNEELRSATEELETSREELQSINEELTTVNIELKGNLDALAHSNSDMQNLMDATAIATVFLDRQLRITRYTPAAAPLFNLIPGDVGRPLSDLTTLLDYPGVGDDARRVLDRLVPVEREVGMADARTFLARLLPYRTLDDHIAGVVLTFIDVSERKRGQEALRSVEERFTSIVTQALAGVAQVTLDGVVTYANRHFCNLVAVGDSQLVGRPLHAVWHVEDRARMAGRFAQLVADGAPFRDSVRALHADGSVVWLLTSVALLAASGGGEPRSALVVCTDVSESKRTEQALRDSEERLRLIFENVVEYAIFTIDNQRRITRWNAGAERVLGYTEDEVVGQRFDILFADASRAADEVRLAQTEGRAADDGQLVRKDGSRFWASGALMPMADASGRVVGYVKVLRDQTKTLVTQHALEESRAALQAADVAKDRFLAVLSHELRNPLAAVTNAAHALQAGAVDLPGRRAVHIVQRQSQVMKLLLDDLLDMSRLRAGRLVLRRRDVTLADVIDSALEAVQPQIESRRHALTVSLPPQPVLLHVDALRIAQVLSNLIGNAARYTPGGGRIVLEADVADGAIVFSVSDNGIGMSTDTVDSMFEMFFQQAGAGPETLSPGLGIGLALVKSLVELHGGSVHGASAGLDRGSRFTVTLPLPPQPAQPDTPAPQPADDAAAPARQRVLLADDNADITWSTAALLQQSGHDVHVASSGEEAVRMAAALAPDVAVLDIGMPDLSGYDVARRIRALPGGDGVLLVAATGWGQHDDQRAALEAGFDVHLVKPVDIRQLVRLIAERRG